MTKTISDLRRANLRALIKSRFGESQTAFRDATGVSLSQVGQWLNASMEGSRNMGEKSARRIEEACALPTGWLDRELPAGMASANSERGTWSETETPHPPGKQIIVWEKPDDLPPDEGRVWIPRYDVSCSAGNGAEEWTLREKQALPFTLDFFKAIGSNPEHCRLINIRGDSMEPYLFDRDMAMVDTQRGEVQDGKVYAFCFGNELFVKQIFKQFDGSLTLHSYNPRYPDRGVPTNEAVHFGVMGQIIYRSGSGLP